MFGHSVVNDPALKGVGHLVLPLRDSPPLSIYFTSAQNPSSQSIDSESLSTRARFLLTTLNAFSIHNVMTWAGKRIVASIQCSARRNFGLTLSHFGWLNRIVDYSIRTHALA